MQTAVRDFVLNSTVQNIILNDPRLSNLSLPFIALDGNETRALFRRCVLVAHVLFQCGASLLWSVGLC